MTPRDKVRELAEFLAQDCRTADYERKADELEARLRAFLAEREGERDRLWCSAIVATQKDRDGRMVCDVEDLTRYFNEHRAELDREGESDD